MLNQAKKVTDQNPEFGTRKEKEKKRAPRRATIEIHVQRFEKSRK